MSQKRQVTNEHRKQQDWHEWKIQSLAYQQIQERGLIQNLEELEEEGYTVLTPEQIGNPRILERARAAILRLLEEHTGVKHDIETGAHGAIDTWAHSQGQYLLYGFLEKDPVFEEIIQHPMTLPFMEYFLGPDCLLSSLTCFIKWQNAEGYGTGLGLHADDGMPFFAPLPDPPQVFNSNWFLTDYTKANGAFCVVPGSHKLRRQLNTGEGVEDAIPVEGPAGSVVVFHGNLWHGAFPRLNPGLRISINPFMVGYHYRVQENFQGRISDEILARNGVRFRKLLNIDDIWGHDDWRGPIPWHERASGKTWSELMRDPVQINGKDYRIVLDRNNRPSELAYVPVDAD